MTHRNKRRGVLVPLLEDMMLKTTLEIATPEDVAFMEGLMQGMMEREQNRRNGKRPFSPSALASCMRQVYLIRHFRELGIEPTRLPRVEPAYYFLTGNFLHLKWQFALYKLEQWIGDGTVFELLALELPVKSKRGDHAGTADALITAYRVPYVVDFKGLNVRSFGQVQRGNIPDGYEIQLTDYMYLYNADMKLQKKYGIKRIENGLLIAENKGGPVNGHPLALHETTVLYDDYKPEVKRRLNVLREHEANEEIPPPECKSTRGFQFSGCPFAKFCKKEVQAIEKRRAKVERRNTEQPRVAVPEKRRASRSR